MKLLAALIMTASLVVGLVASVTAYVPTLDSIDPEDNLTLNAPAGIDPDDPEKPRIVPVAEEEEVILTAELIEQLRADGEVRVRVKEFAWERWEYRWWFVGAAFFLFVGAMMMRSVTKKAVSAAALATEQTDVSPPQLLETAHEQLTDLQRELQATAAVDARLDLILKRLDAVHDAQFDPFVGARSTLIGQLGMTGYAQLMDKFAAAERQFNRAWSAAADGVLEEAEECLVNGIELLEEARHRLAAL